uniref:type II toxin-antitoxin system RelE/ParE family toxin n=1 Tax=uncultured Caulobacter sp. TaxID=158749 RepID=UPI0025E9F7A1|nr:type II toxin-antitoxin system RelE/ParE family toxin [uncultured Caulobacter sp.]
MRRSLHVSAAARLDIERLHDWLFERNPKAALRLIATLDAQLEGLADFSERGRSVGEGVRELIVPFGGATYVIRYDVDPDSVAIARVWHSLEDR